jgi:peptidoglycan/xylan/chitin deacetylase (PgdA/CDA1 family)
MKICTLTYHEVVDNPNDSGIIRESAIPYKHTIREFTDHVKIFKSNLVKTPKISEVDMEKGEGVCHIISFDDGGISNLIAADILEQNGLIGHFLITSNFIGKQGFLNNNQIYDLYSRGHVIGSHSKSHPDVFYRLSYDSMIDEWRKSKSILEDIIGDNVTCASIPGGEMDEKTWKSSAEAGLSYLFCSEPFFNPKKKDNWLLGRVCPKRGAEYRKITKIINFKGYNSEMNVRKIKNVVKRFYYPLHDLFKLK